MVVDKQLTIRLGIDGLEVRYEKYGHQYAIFQGDEEIAYLGYNYQQASEAILTYIRDHAYAEEHRLRLNEKRKNERNIQSGVSHTASQ